MDLTETFEKTITSGEVERWRYPRFFTENIGKTAIVTGDDAKHITAVLRMKKGDKAIICDGKGTDFLCRIMEAEKEFVELEILESQPNKAEPSVNLRLFQCMPKSDKMEFIVQKATELGAVEIIPVLSKRCVSRPDKKSAEKKIQRYQKIADEASKQCGRGKIPHVAELTTFEEAVKSVDKSDLGIIFYECGGKSLKELTEGFNGREISVFIGCEGGFEPEEIRLAMKYGICPASLGERILRCETAPVAAIAVLMNLTGNL